MVCPFCQTRLNYRDFHNISLTAICPHCQKPLVFNPNFFALLVFVAGSYFLANMLPPFANPVFDFICGFVLVFVLVVITLRLLLFFKLGKVVGYQARGK